ncbi:MAG: histidine--tRNA ligase [Rhodospirillales bacterium]|nr:histidine--tRNA ligase [Rhodospirillales bacterium]
MASLQPVRGTRDIIGDECRRHRHIEGTAHDIARRYGYDEISTPVFEFSEVFQRSLGETSDIVSKEMYSFEDRGGASITLRPENTAGVVRAVISNGLTQQTPVKLFYRGPMFRYERPQKGRQRQFHQVGVELLGVAEPLADVEAIALGADILDALGLKDHVVLELNSLGDTASRQTYRQVLVDYLQARRERLSPDSQARLERNPLRILDSKDEGDRALVADAPNITDSLNDASRCFLDTVCAGLDALAIPYRLNPRLVRGLDYYCHTAFEFTTDALGAQNAVLAGGRYDGLAEHLGGPPTPGIGWAAGVERLAMLIAEAPPAPRPLAVAPVAEGQAPAALAICRQLRGAGFVVDMAFGGKFAKRLKRANKISARVTIIIGEDELAREAVLLRDMDTGAQHEVALASLVDDVARVY